MRDFIKKQVSDMFKCYKMDIRGALLDKIAEVVEVLLKKSLPVVYGPLREGGFLIRVYTDNPDEALKIIEKELPVVDVTYKAKDRELTAVISLHNKPRLSTVPVG